MIDLTTTPLIFLDVETTGFSASKCRIIEVAAIKVINGEVVDKFVTFINPECELPEAIITLTGITDAELADAPLFAAIVPELQKILADGLLVAHNAKFDYSFLSAEFERAGHPFNMSSLCTVDLARVYHPELPKHRLADIIAHYQFETAERHRAYDDALVLVQFTAKLREQFGDERWHTECYRHINDVVTVPA